MTEESLKESRNGSRKEHKSDHKRSHKRRQREYKREHKRDLKKRIKMSINNKREQKEWNKQNPKENKRERLPSEEEKSEPCPVGWACFITKSCTLLMNGNLPASDCLLEYFCVENLLTILTVTVGTVIQK